MGPSSFGLYCTLEIIYSLVAVGLLCQSLANVSETRGGDSYWFLAIFPLLTIHAALLTFNGIRKEVSAKVVSLMLFIGYGSYVLWPFSAGAEHSAIPWSWLFGIYAMLVPVFEESPRASILHCLVSPALLVASSMAAHLLTGAPLNGVDLTIRVAYLLFCCALLAGLARFALNAVRESDKTYYETLSAQLLLNRSRDYSKELQDFDKLVHDNVMAALLDASRNPGELPQRTRLLARRAIAVLEEEALKSQPQRPITFQALTEQIAEGVEPWNQRLRFVSDSVEKHPLASPDSTLPYTAARAFTHAVTEAVSNSARHSGTRTTQISIRTEMRRPFNSTRSDEVRPYILCTISDRGQGFSVSDIDFRRLGVRVSMIRSMEEAGGRVTISSAPEKGTRVVVQWPHEEPNAG
ncbi:MAG: ATP-binding protein [Rothia sp. (in: high G+C Gram-positive bacteria)]|nr:ATP-binding protein [Rothia sp. (in: high G+C Gram-positive bacteria)]